MNLLALYLKDFNHEYLTHPADRRRTARETLKFLALTATFLLTAWLWGLFRP